MIVVVEPLQLGRSHLPFNLAVLGIIARRHPDTPLHLFADPSHIDALVETDPTLPEAWHCHPTPVAVLTDSIAAGGRFRDPAASEWLAAADKAAQVVALGATAPVLDGLRRMAERSRAAWEVTLHAHIAEPAVWRSRNPLRRRRDMFGILGRRFPDNLRLDFLERSILDTARPLLDRRTATAVLEHPVYPDVSYPKAEHDALRIAFVGGTTRAKGFEHFKQAARARALTGAEYHSVGSASRGYHRGDDALFATPPAAGKLDHATYDALLSTMDMIFLPLDPLFYSWTASGSLMDCIRLGIPPLVTATPTVRDLARRYGDFGYVVDTPEASATALAALTRARIDADLPRFRDTLANIRRDRSVDALAASFALHRVAS